MGQYELTGNNRIILGEFPCDRTYKEEMTLIYNDRTYTITLENDFRWKKKSPCISTTLSFDGKRLDDKEIILIKSFGMGG